MKFHFFKADYLPATVLRRAFIAIPDGTGCKLYVSNNDTWVPITGVVAVTDTTAIITTAIANIALDDMTETTTYISQQLTALGIVTAGDITSAMIAAGITGELDQVTKNIVIDFIANNAVPTTYMANAITSAFPTDTYTVDELMASMTVKLAPYRKTVDMLEDVRVRTEAYVSANVENKQWIAERYVNSQVPLNKDPLRGAFTTSMEECDYQTEGVRVQLNSMLVNDKMPDNLVTYPGVTLAHSERCRYNEVPVANSHIDQFLVHMGYTLNARYSPPFNIVKVTTGAAATLQPDIYYPDLYRSIRYINIQPLLPLRYTMCPGGENSLTVTVKVLTGSAKIKALIRDGVRVNTDPALAGIPYSGHDTVIVPADGWVTITAVREAVVQESGVMFPAMSADSEMLIGSPHVTDGRFVPVKEYKPFLLP